MSNHAMSARGRYEGRFANRKGLAKLFGIVFAVMLACVVPAIAFATPAGLTSAQGDQFVYTLNADTQAGVTQDGSSITIDIASAGDTSTATIDVAYPANTYMTGLVKLALKDSQGGTLTSGTVIAGSNYTENANGFTLVQPIASTANDAITFEADGDIVAGTTLAAQTTLHKATVTLPKATAGTVVNIVVCNNTSAVNGEGNQIWAAANEYTIATITYVDSSVESPIFSVYKQQVDENGTAVGDRVLVKTYTKSQLKAIATTQDATGTVGWELVKAPSDVRVYGSSEYVTYENLFANAGISSLWKSGSVITFTCSDGPYTKAEHSYDAVAAGKFYPVVGSDEGAYSVPGALLLSYKYYSAANYDNASAALAAAITDSYANELPSAIISSSTSVAEDMLWPKNVPSGVTEITLNYKEAPVLTIYKQEANDAEPTLVKSYTKSELQAIATTQTSETVNPAAWTVVKSNRARVYTASQYVSFTNLFADAALSSQWADGSYLTFTCNDGPYSKAQYTYADVKAGKFYADLAEASSAYSVDGAVLINWGNAYADEHDNAAAAQAAALANAYDGGNLACALGSASNDVNEMLANAYVPNGVVSITLHYSDPVVLKIYTQGSSSSEPVLVKSYTRSQLDKIATYQTSETENPVGWELTKGGSVRVYGAAEFVSYSALFVDAGIADKWTEGSYLQFKTGADEQVYTKVSPTYAVVKAGKFYADLTDEASAYAVDGAVIMKWAYKDAAAYDNAAAALDAALDAATDDGTLSAILSSSSNVMDNMLAPNNVPNGVTVITLNYDEYTANATTADNTLKVGDTFTVDVNMMGQAYACASGSLSYNTSALRLVSITQGAGLAGDGLSFATEGNAFSFYGNTADTTAGVVVATYTFECIAVTTDTNIVLTFDVAGKSGSFEELTVQVAEKVSKEIINSGLTLGDLNNNAKINIVDAQICYDLATAVYGTAYENFPLFDGWTVADLKFVADANGDKTVDATDARAIQHYGLFGAWE